VVDVCAAPGGKATAAASLGGRVVAADFRPKRVGLVAGNAVRTASGRPDEGAVWPLVADARRPALRDGVAHVVLVDAPCSGLGVLRRRPDARWRVTEQDVTELAVLQTSILESSAALVRPGGRLVYSVCTLTAAETIEVAERFTETHPEFTLADAPGGPWQPWGSGALLLPQTDDSDGMAWFGWRCES
jgi:16S rRNA (cytosine967-C5)-methyltransferase